MARNDGYNYEDGYSIEQMPMPPPQPLNMGGMGYGSFTSPSMDPSIANMRWNPEAVVYELYKRLAAVEIKITEDRQVTYQPIPNVRPKMNFEGIQTILTTIESVVNPFVSLTNINDEEANELIRQLLVSVACDLVYNQDRFAIHQGDMRLIMNVVKGLVFSQVKRAVAGHESKNFHTQTVEQTMQQHSTMQQGNQNSWFPKMFGGKK